MGDEAKGHVLTDEEYTQFLRLQEMFLNQPNDNIQSEGPGVKCLEIVDFST